MTHLTKLANKFETDKGTMHSWAHGYTEFYEPFFNKVKEINVLEIGIEKGGSLRMLKEFFGDNANIYGVDKEQNTMFNENGITTMVADQSSRESLAELKTKLGDVKFDIIIDDGSHEPKDQIITLLLLHDMLKPNGMYILEDLHSNIANVYNDIFKSTPLFFLAFFAPSEFLTEEENASLLSSIKDVKISSTFNSFFLSGNVKNRSITSIITFK